jgi:hypothetical protein
MALEEGSGGKLPLTKQAANKQYFGLIIAGS